MDLFRHLADQLVNIEARQDGVGDGHQDAEVIALVAQQVVIDVVADPALDLLGHDGDNLRESMQALVLFFAPWPVVVADEFTTAEDAAFRRQRQQAVVAEFRVNAAGGQLRPGFGEGRVVAM